MANIMCLRPGLWIKCPGVVGEKAGRVRQCKILANSARPLDFFLKAKGNTDKFQMVE